MINDNVSIVNAPETLAKSAPSAVFDLDELPR